MEEENKHHRRIRSFVRREGRMTVSQKRALSELWPRYGIDPSDAPLNFSELFGRDAAQHPTNLEIGFGMGHSLLELAIRHPEENFLGVEVHRPGVGHLLTEIEQHNLTNLRLFQHDAIEVLEKQIPDSSLRSVLLFFPDPWHKKRHNKRRIVQPDFVQTVVEKLQPDGFFHLATDWEDYAHWMMEIVSVHPNLTNITGAGNFTPRPDSRPVTKFEKRGLRLGHSVWDLVFEKQ